MNDPLTIISSRKNWPNNYYLHINLHDVAWFRNGLTNVKFYDMKGKLNTGPTQMARQRPAQSSSLIRYVGWQMQTGQAGKGFYVVACTSNTSAFEVAITLSHQSLSKKNQVINNTVKWFYLFVCSLFEGINVSNFLYKLDQIRNCLIPQEMKVFVFWMWGGAHS